MTSNFKESREALKDLKEKEMKLNNVISILEAKLQESSKNLEEFAKKMQQREASGAEHGQNLGSSKDLHGGSSTLQKVTKYLFQLKTILFKP
ncbi:hypothetical protein XELAEV_18043995mg [Xenopus laevis]|uniref:Uncharacterized protein n=1 Tax=Xenopus laevis TaxID=8355 RepID=A0A974BY12_XENLA|nr:hypothetical protein XELAEV_18043995mg [Xenopus laevis]